MNDSLSIHIDVYSDVHGPAEMSDLLQVPSEKSHVRGEETFLSKKFELKPARTYDASLWSIWSDADSGAMDDEHLASLWPRAVVALANVHLLAGEPVVFLRMIHKMDAREQTGHGLGLTAECIHLLAAANAQLDIDQYVLPAVD